MESKIPEGETRMGEILYVVIDSPGGGGGDFQVAVGIWRMHWYEAARLHAWLQFAQGDA